MKANIATKRRHVELICEAILIKTVHYIQSRSYISVCFFKDTEYILISLNDSYNTFEMDYFAIIISYSGLVGVEMQYF